MVFGHRGARGNYPENTLSGFLYAAGLGVDGIEMDVVISKDNKVVVSHEPWMRRKICTPPRIDAMYGASKNTKNIYRMNYADIAQYDCGIKGNPGFPGQKRIPERKPLLSEVIEKIETFSNKPVYLVEIKCKRRTDNKSHPPPEEFVTLVINEILPFNINDRIIIQSFDMRPLNYVHQFNNSQFTTHNSQFKKLGIGMLVKRPRFIDGKLLNLSFIPDTCGIYYKFTTEKWIKKIQSMGMKVLIWTVNEEKDIKKFLSLGADGIITDYPSLGKSLSAGAKCE